MVSPAPPMTNTPPDGFDKWPPMVSQNDSSSVHTAKFVLISFVVIVIDTHTVITHIVIAYINKFVL